MSFLPVRWKEAIQSIEYGWTKPKSLVVLVPVVSLVVQNVQLEAFPTRSIFSLTLPADDEQVEFPSTGRANKIIILNDKNKKIPTILNWHGVGALIHTFVMSFFLYRFPILIAPIGISAYQMWRCFFSSDRPIAFKKEIEFRPRNIQ